MTRGRVRARPCVNVKTPISDPSGPLLLTYHKDARARARGHAREMTPVRAFGPLFIHPRVYRRPAFPDDFRGFAPQNRQNRAKRAKKWPKTAKKGGQKGQKRGQKRVRKVVPGMGRITPEKCWENSAKRGAKRGPKMAKKGSKTTKKGQKKCEKRAKKEQKRGEKGVKNG